MMLCIPIPRKMGKVNDFLYNESSKENVVIENFDELLIKSIDKSLEEADDVFVENIEQIPSEPVVPTLSNVGNAFETSEKLTRHSLYLNLLNLLYENGKKTIGEEMISYSDLKKSIETINPELSEKDIKDFLLVCNLLKITEFKNGVGRFGKDFDEASFLMSKV